MDKPTPKNIYFFILLILVAYFLFRLINQGQMINEFPIDQYANDYSSHLAKVFFFDKYGLYNNVPNWYNGTYTLLTFYPFGWYLMTLPIYQFTGNILLTGYLSLLLLYLLGFLFLYFFGRTVKLSRFQRVLFFLFFFVNPIAIGYFLRLGKMPEMFGWVIAISIASVVFYYKEKPLDKKFLFIIPLYIALFYTHILVFIVASLFFLMLFLSRKTVKERIFLALSWIPILAITSFFWIPFLKNSSENVVSNYYSLQWLILPGNMTDKIVSLIIPLVFFSLFFLYWKSHEKDKKELVFFSVPLVFAFLHFTRIAVFLPLFNRPTPDSYHFFFIFLMIYLVFKIKLDSFSLSFQKYFTYALFFAVVLGVIISLTFTPLFQHHSENIKETFSLLKEVDGKLLVLKTPPEVFRGAVYSYGAIHYNISTPSGWEPVNITREYSEQLSLPSRYLEEKNCDDLKISLIELDTTNIITFNEYCSFLQECRFTLINKKEHACLYQLESIL